MYATIQEVKDRTSFEEVSALSDGKIVGYIERAEGWIHRATGRKFREETNPDVLAELRAGTILLVELLWLQDNPDIKESAVLGIESEKIGSYSYTAKNLQPGEKTGISELDSILESLKVQPISGLSFFSVSGPSRSEV